MLRWKMAQVTVSQTMLPPHHPLHGTPHQVIHRLFTFELPSGQAEVDQSDYGHPGRFNPCHAKRIPPSLRLRMRDILVAAEALPAYSSRPRLTQLEADVALRPGGASEYLATSSCLSTLPIGLRGMESVTITCLGHL